MNKWGTKSEFSGFVIFGTLVLSYFTDNKYILLLGVITGGALLLSTFYDSWKNKPKKNEVISKHLFLYLLSTFFLLFVLI